MWAASARKISVAPDQRVPPPTMSDRPLRAVQRGNRGIERLGISARRVARGRLRDCGFALLGFERAQHVGGKID